MCILAHIYKQRKDRCAYTEVTRNGLLPYRGLRWAASRSRRAAGKHYQEFLASDFRGTRGLITKGLFGLLRAAGKNTPHMKAYHVWSKGMACLASYKVGFVLLAILLRLDHARLSKIWGVWFCFFTLFLFLFRGARPSFLFRAVHICEEVRSTSFITTAPGTEHMRRRVERGCNCTYSLVIECTTVL